MKRIALIAFSTLAVLVALFSYPTSTGHSGTSAAQAVSSAKVVVGQSGGSASSTGQGPDPAKSGSASTGAAAPTSGAGAPAGSSAAAPVTVDGAEEMTRYGVVQVQVVITGGKITNVTAVKYPQAERRDVLINNQALPLLKAQVLSAQSAKIDGVSGATFTSDGYITSLQSALDAAGFAS